jgi:glycosyltransferase involved in cell wall biosynthesis
VRRAVDGRLLVGFAGRIWRPKGLEVLAQAARDADVALMLCGPVSDADVAEAVQEFGGVLLPALNKEQLPIFYSALDLFVLPSQITPSGASSSGGSAPRRCSAARLPSGPTSAASPAWWAIPRSSSPPM